MGVLLADFDRTLEADGFYRTAYPRRYFAAKAFVAAVIEQARSRGCWTVVSQTDNELMATVYDPARVPRSGTVWGALPAPSLARNVEI